MEIRLDCSVNLSLQGISEIENINCLIDSYEFKEKMISGLLEITGSYKDNNGDICEFIENEPFSLIFNKDNIKIDDLSICDLNYFVIVNQSVQCELTLKIEYEDIKKEINEFNEKSLVYSEDSNEKIVNDKIIEEHLVDIKEEIEEEYDEKLTEILLPRVESVNEDPITDNNVIVSEIKKDNNMVDLRKIKNVYSSYKVFFVENEKKLEEICKKENISINEVLKDNQNYEENKKIILK